jgi:hypothetical protein
MAAATRREGQYQRACLDAVEAALLTGREGQVFPATAVEDDVVQILAPAVEARIKGAGLTPGSTVRVQVESASIADRAVRLAVVPDAGA